MALVNEGERTRRAREFSYGDREFRRVQGLIHERVGIHLGANKQEMVYSRLARRLRATGIGSMAVYLDQLADPEHPEWQEFINALTTNLTSFFREAHHFDTLADYLQKASGRRDPFRIWCCAASTGEEPYSIAMTAAQALGGWDRVDIVASDVDTRALATAQRGVYPLERVSKLDRALLKRFFLKGKGSNAGMVRVRPEVRQAVRFEQVNLLENQWPEQGPLDAIFCRNVFIYFQQSTQADLLHRFHRLLRPEGLFFAGHSESLMSSGERFRSLGRTVFVPVAGHE